LHLQAVSETLFLSSTFTLFRSENSAQPHNRSPLTGPEVRHIRGSILFGVNLLNSTFHVAVSGQ
jgi:hypothetical protein